MNHKHIIAGFYFPISNKNYHQRVIKDLSEFYVNHVNQQVIGTEMKLCHTHVDKLSVHGVLDAFAKCNNDRFPNIFKLLQPYPCYVL